MSSYSEAKHFLGCRHQIGQNGFDYSMPCDILKTMPDGRLKVRVWGDRYWSRDKHKNRIRYVEAYLVEEVQYQEELF